MSRHINLIVFTLGLTLCIVLGASLSAYAEDEGLENGQYTVNMDSCKKQHWILPVSGFESPEIEHMFDHGLDKYSAGHRGLDLRSQVGDTIIAPASGEILWKGVVGGHPTVTFKSGAYKLTFTPISTSHKAGDTIEAGGELGTLVQNTDGTNHCDDAPCLHWGVILGEDTYLDPAAFVYKPRIILKHDER